MVRQVRIVLVCISSLKDAQTGDITGYLARIVERMSKARHERSIVYLVKVIKIVCGYS